MEETKILLNKVYCQDCLSFLNNMSNDYVDMFFCDPPYNASKTKPLIWKEKSYTKINAEWDKIEDLDGFNNNWIKSIIPKMKEGGILFITCSFHNLNSLLNVLNQSELKFRNIITWFKPNAIPMQSANQGYFAYSCEYVLFYSKGKINHRWNYKWIKQENNGIQKRDLFDFKVCQDKKTGHPSQKPLSLLRYLIQTCTKEGDLVGDIFSGSGTTALASKQLNRKFIGCDNNKEYVEMAQMKNKQSRLSL